MKIPRIPQFLQLALFMLIVIGGLLAYEKLIDPMPGSTRQQPPSVHTQAASAPKFKTRIDLQNYPDLAMSIKFRISPADTLLHSLNRCIATFAKQRRAYADHLRFDSATGQYIVMFDFQSAPVLTDVVVNDFLARLAGIDSTGLIEQLSIE